VIAGLRARLARGGSAALALRVAALLRPSPPPRLPPYGGAVRQVGGAPRSHGENQ
jgi:hypothetical protein